MRMVALMLLAVTAGWSAESPLAATALRWAAGRTTLAAAVARLNVGDNRVWLGNGLNDAVEAEVPAVAGTWWDGVIALCQAFRLRPDDGESPEEHLGLPGVPVPIGQGTLVLSRGRLPGMQAVGGLLACAEADDTVRLWLRAEPRVGRGRLAWANADTAAIAAERNISLERAPSIRSTARPATWFSNTPLPNGSRLVVAAQAAEVNWWKDRCRLVVGETARPQAEGQALSALLLVDPLVTTWEGNPLPERRPLVALTGPASLVQRLQFRLRQGDADVATRTGETRTNGDGSLVMYRYLRGTPQGPIDIEIDGRRIETPRHLDLSLLLPAPEAGTTIPVEAAVRLSWEAGQRPMTQWLGMLAATGNPVLPEVGVDTAAMVTMPAVRGGFWDGLLALCAATGLTPATSSEAILSGGAVRLVRHPLLAMASCGPLLLDAQRVDAPAGGFAVRIHATLEPRLSQDDYAAPSFSWASWAIDEQGRVHPVTTADDSPELQRRTANLAPGKSDAAPEIVTIRPATSGVRRLLLNGLVTLPRVRMWRSSSELAVNQPSEVLLGNTAVELLVLSEQTRIRDILCGPALVVRGLSGASSVQFTLTTPDGQAVDGNHDANSASGGTLWVGSTRVPGQGRLTADLVVRAALPPLVLPVQLSVPVPDGL